MNALYPPTAATETSTGSPPGSTTDTPQWIDAERSARLVGVLTVSFTALALALLAAQAFAPIWVVGFSWMATPALLVPLAGLLATRPMARARTRFNATTRLGRLARRPQGIIIPIVAACALVLLLVARDQAGLAGPHAITLGVAALVLGFPLLIAERMIAAVSPSSLPEAQDLRALLFVPVLAIPAAGLLQIGVAVGIPYMSVAAAVLATVLAVTAAELGLRALANWFLPPPTPFRARAAVACLSASLLQPGRLGPGGLAAPIYTHLGIDFSRSWAVRFARSAAMPIGLALSAIAWGLSGVSLIEQDRRGIYERLGEPVSVWGPGAHFGLPWPLGRVRRVDLGLVHAIPLRGNPVAEPNSPAEAAAPPSADRLWDQVHPSEMSYLLASRESDGRQGFQTVNVDMTVLYRIGLDDLSALKAAYAVESPDALVRAEAGRLMVGELAGTELADALGAGREALTGSLQARLQTALDGFDSGIRLVGISIEAIHPPPAAADAYHAVQAAEIIANTAISTERGRARAAVARNQQQATELTLTAQGAAAETIGQAEIASRFFAADRAAAATGEEAFRFERYLATVGVALAKAPLVIIDRDLAGADAPSIDLRSFGAPPTRAAGDD